MDFKEPKLFYEPITKKMVYVSEEEIKKVKEENPLNLQHVSFEDFCKAMNNKETFKLG